MECDSKLQHIRHAIACTRLCTRLKCWRHAKKACLVCLKKLQGVRQITRLKQHFLSFVFYITQKSCALLFDWFSGENCIIFTFPLHKG